MATIEAGGRGGRLTACTFHPLPARPMRIHRVADGVRAEGLEREIAAVLAASPPDVVLQVRVPAALAGASVLRAEHLRALAPPTANVSISVAVGVEHRGQRQKAGTVASSPLEATSTDAGRAGATTSPSIRS